MATQVTGGLYEELDGKLVEIKRQMRQAGGYPFDPEKLNMFLQRAVEGRFNDGQRWQKKDGIIYFDATFDGTSGPDWIPRLERGGKRIGDYAKSLLRSADFKPTSVGTAKIAVLPGELFADDNRITRKIRDDADTRKLNKPNADLGCVIREMFTDKEIGEMGLRWIIAMHEPIVDSSGYPSLLGASRSDGGGWLRACYDGPGIGWSRDSGFAFVSQVSS